MWPVEVDNHGFGISPQRLCDHVLQLMLADLARAAETVTQQDQEDIRATCVKGVDEERVQVGEAAYAKQAECIMRAQTLVDLEPCNHADAPRGDGPMPSNREVCDHLVVLIEREFADNGTTLSEPDRAAFVDKCPADLETEKQTVGPVEFEREVRCVMAAQTFEELMACEPSGS